MEWFEKIVDVESEVQAQLLDRVLSERGIPHLMRSYHDSAYDGLFQAQRGWGHIEAPGPFKEEILGIVEDLKHSTSSDRAASGNGAESAS